MVVVGRVIITSTASWWQLLSSSFLKARVASYSLRIPCTPKILIFVNYRQQVLLKIQMQGQLWQPSSSFFEAHHAYVAVGQIICVIVVQKRPVPKPRMLE